MLISRCADCDAQRPPGNTQNKRLKLASKTLAPAHTGPGSGALTPSWLSSKSPQGQREGALKELQAPRPWRCPHETLSCLGDRHCCARRGLSSVPLPPDQKTQSRGGGGPARAQGGLPQLFPHTHPVTGFFRLPLAPRPPGDSPRLVLP